MYCNLCGFIQPTFNVSLRKSEIDAGVFNILQGKYVGKFCSC